MAGKLANRKELRSQSEAAEKLQSAGKTSKGARGAAKDGAKPTAPKRKSRSKTAKEVRLKAFWGVFNQSLKQIALFEYSQRKEADKRAAELSISHKTPHFVQPVKEVIHD